MPNVVISSANASMKVNKASKYAIEEITPNHFIINDVRVTPFLRGEGDLVGNRFTLTSWRRNGMLARIAERGLSVFALEQMIEKLPHLPMAFPIGDEVFHPQHNTTDRYSYFDPTTYTITPCEPYTYEGVPGVIMRLGWIIRIRRSRGMTEWHVCRMGGRQLQWTHPLSEQSALLHGFAQAQYEAPVLRTSVDQDVVTLTLPALPDAYERLLRKCALANSNARVWTFPMAHAIFVVQILAELGITIDTSNLVLPEPDEDDEDDAEYDEEDDAWVYGDEDDDDEDDDD